MTSGLTFVRKLVGARWQKKLLGGRQIKLWKLICFTHALDENSVIFYIKGHAIDAKLNFIAKKGLSLGYTVLRSKQLLIVIL